MANTCVIKRDASAKELVLEVVDPTGAVVATAGRIVIALTNPALAPANYQELAIRETKGCNDAGDTVYCMVLRTKWYDTAVLPDQD